MKTRPATRRGALALVSSLATAVFLTCVGTPGSAVLAAPLADPAGVTVHAVLRKTIFRFDVVALELWLGRATMREAAEALANDASADGRSGAARDELARVVASSRQARAVMVFQRNVSLHRFLAGVMKDMRGAREAGLLSGAGYEEVSAGLPVWLAPLRDDGLGRGDRFRQFVVGDTLRTVVERRGGEVVVDQTDVGTEHRQALLGSFVAPGSGFRDQILDELASALQEEILATNPAAGAPGDQNGRGRATADGP